MDRGSDCAFCEKKTRTDYAGKEFQNLPCSSYPDKYQNSGMLCMAYCQFWYCPRRICPSKPYYPTLAQSSSELGTNHSCGNSYIQRLRSLSFLWIIRNIQSPINKCFHLSTYSISFISHYNQSVSITSLRIDYISIEECSINRNPFEWRN